MTIKDPIAFLKSIPPEQLASVKKQLDKHLAERSLYHFVKQAWKWIDSASFVDSWALQGLCQHLEAVTRGEIRFLLVNFPPRCSKPVSRDALVLTRVKGLIPLGEIVVGDEVWTHKGRWRKVLEVHRQGVIPTVKLTTWSGRSVHAAPDHPFWTPEGWVQVGHLKPEDVVGVSPCTEECGINSISSEEARLLGYVVGDGHCGGTLSITSADDPSAADIIHCAQTMGFVPKEQKYKMANTGYMLRRIAINAAHVENYRKKGYVGPVRQWLAKHGLDKQSSYTKCVPEAVLRGSNDVVRNFIQAYWACDGFVTTRAPKADPSQRKDLILGCDSVNYAFLQQMQILLARLGINSRVRKKVAKIKTKKQGDSYTSFTLSITTQDDTWRFAQQINIPHTKGEKLRAAYKRRFDFDRPMWGDTVVSVEDSGSKECMCLTVEGDHSFTANGYAVHNTLITSVIWPLWIWIQKDISHTSGPQVGIAGASYGQDLSLKSSDKMRDLIGSPWFQENWGDKVQIKAGSDTKSDFANTKGGYRQATSITGRLLGYGGAIWIVDDPHNTEDVESEAERENVLRGWREISGTRMNDPKRSAIVVIMQRLNEQDVSGDILSSRTKREWVHYCIPMRHDSGRHCTTYLPGDDEVFWEDPRVEDGELMWAERFGDEEVDAMEIDLGPYMASGRLQQSPSPAGGGIIKREWWQLWDGPTDANGREQFPELELVVGSLDPAYTEKQENDYSALTIWGLWRKNGVPKLILLNAWQKRLTLHGPAFDPHDTPGWDLMDAAARAAIQRKNWGLVEWVNHSCTRFRCDKLLIEAKASGLSVAQEMRRLYRDAQFSVETVNPKAQDKVARMHAVVPMFADSMIYAPDREWAETVISHIEVFPKGAHDDLADSTSQCLKYMRDTGLIVRRDEFSVDSEDEKKYRSPLKPLYPA